MSVENDSFTRSELAPRSTRPVFIVGCPRSGTTWLYHTLLSAGRFAIYRSETRIYSSFAPCYGNFRTPGRRAAFLKKWLPSEYFVRSGLDDGSFYLKAMQLGGSPGSMLRLFMQEICDYQHAARWAECTPDFALSVAAIKRDFPEALFVHIVRDGRDVAMSLAKQGFIAPFRWHARQPEIAAAAYWAWIVRTVERQARDFLDDVLTLKYEDLVTDYARSLERLSTFVGQEIDSARVATSQIGAVGRPNTSFAAQAPAEAQSIGRWKSAFGADFLATITAMIGDTLVAHGYECPPESGRAAADARLQARAYAARFRTMWLLRTRTPLGRYASDGIDGIATERQPDDLTLRPSDHLEEIRRLVSG